MSVIRETVCGVNVQLDRLQQQIACSPTVGVTDVSAESLELIDQLQDISNSISVTSKTQPLLSPSRLADLLSGPPFSGLQVQTLDTSGYSPQIVDHLWVVAAKAAVQASGLVMKILLDQTLQLCDETSYWGEMLGSPWYTGLYVVQRSPEQLYQWTKHACIAQTQGVPILSTRWSRFFQIAHPNAWTLGAHSIRAHLLSPIRSSRAEMRQKRDLLLAMKELHTSSLGLLMEGCHLFDTKESSPNSRVGTMNGELSDAISRAVRLVEAIFQQIPLAPSTRELEQGVFATLDKNSKNVRQMQGEDLMHKPLDLIERLVHVLRENLPEHVASMSQFNTLQGRPSCIVRYWLPISAALLSGSTSIKFLANRQEQILQWIFDIGSTTVDFWSNWVVHPVCKLIGTIRHDEKSEIAIMSKNSLLADRASLERMVVDFVRDRPDLSKGAAAADTTAIVHSVKEGDLTPVLKAYERDLRSPFVGTVRGDLIRALLIQIQKTKVDVEIAISGIDALLKSQELVFGFVGLTPGILVSFATMRWLGGFLGNRRGLRKGQHRHEVKRGLRNLARILTSSPILSDGTVPYHVSGRLICEAEALLQHVKPLLGGMQYAEFREDIQDLLDLHSGLHKQLQVVERMRWAYCR